MMKGKLSLLVVALLAGCATVPKGPHVAVMPGSGKSFDQFVADDRACRAYADQSLGTDVNAAGASNVATGAAVGTAIGAAAGALLGGHNGAATGAGMGLIVGSAEGSGEAGTAERDVQRRYDIAYEQCMYAKGNQLPVSNPPTSYYRYRNYRQPVIIYQQPPPAVIMQQGVPAQAPPPPGQQPPATSVPAPPNSAPPLP